jgi:hypothetical protein
VPIEEVTVEVTVRVLRPDVEDPDPGSGEVGPRIPLRVVNHGDPVDWPGGWATDGSFRATGPVDLTGVELRAMLFVPNRHLVSGSDFRIVGGSAWGIIHGEYLVDVDHFQIVWPASAPRQPATSGGGGSGSFHGCYGGRIEHGDIDMMGDGIQMSGSSVIRHNHLHSPTLGDTLHNDGIQIYAGEHTITDNIIDLRGAGPLRNGCIFAQGSGIVGGEISRNEFYSGGYQMHLQNGAWRGGGNTHHMSDAKWGARHITNTATWQDLGGNTEVP